MTHSFMANGDVSREDVDELIRLTKAGLLGWRHSNVAHALSAFPVAKGAADDAVISAGVIGGNLRGVRMGYNPQTGCWHYLRLTAHDGSYYYLEGGSPPEQMELGGQLFVLVRKAGRLGGRLKSDRDQLLHCQTCGEETPHRALVDLAHGIRGAHMAGSERSTCTICETSVCISSLRA